MLHFGDSYAKANGMYFDFDKQKMDYQRMESWNPNIKTFRPYAQGYEEKKVQNITQSLLEKTKRSQQRF